jgi:hypothetical protein
MTPTELKRAKTAVLRRIAYDFGITVCRDFTRADILDAIIDRLGEYPGPGWVFLGQYK